MQVGQTDDDCGQVPIILDKALNDLRGGRFAAAGQFCKAALCADPADAKALHFSGIAYLQLGARGPSILAFQRALHSAGPSVQVLSDLGAAVQPGSDGAQAWRLYRLCVVLDPAYAKAYYNAGKISFERKQSDEALYLFRIATLLDPTFAESWSNRAAALLVMGRQLEAMDFYRKSICLHPNGVVPYSNQGSALNDLGRLPEARRSFTQALRLDASRPDTHQNFANYFEKLNMQKEAAARYRAALCLDPAFMMVYANLGTVFMQLGEVEQAAVGYERAMAISPRRGDNYRQRVGIRQIPLRGDIVHAMERLSGDPSLDPTDRTEIHFALGDVYERSKDFDASFNHYADGAALKRKSIHYDIDKELRILRDTKKAFSAKWLADFKAMGHPAEQPVFLIGMPRSGSTLVEQILASHPAVHGAGELAEFGLVFNKMAMQGGFTDMPSFYRGLTPEMTESLGADYIERTLALAPRAWRITDKMLGNFAFAGLIHLALPNAKIIHCRRDPIDTSLSCFSKLFVGDSQPWSYDLTEIGRYFRAYDSLMAHWRDVLPEGVMLDVHYEEVVADLEGQARRIIAYCGLEWDPRCLAFHEADRPVRTASASQVRQPIYKTAVQRGQRYGQRLQPLLDALESPRLDGLDEQTDIPELFEAALSHHQAGRQAAAQKSYIHILTQDPAHTDTLHLLGMLAFQTGLHAQAVALIGKAILANDRIDLYHANLGTVLKDMGREADALASYDRALSLQPNDAPTYANRGSMLNALGHAEEAVTAYDQAIRIMPAYAIAWSNRANTFKDLGRLEEALASYDQAIRLEPGLADAHSNRLMALHYWEGSTGGAVLAAARNFGTQFDRQETAAPFSNPPTLDRRLRIGYVSGDFQRHPVGYFLVQVLANHDSKAVEIFCYTNSRHEDDLTAELRASVDHWRSVASLSDKAAADLVREDGIDILIDLSGHTALNRLTMFALRPAPVQASWLGYFGTTGLAAMDYVLADRFVVPAHDEVCFTEKVYPLPDSYLCFSIPDIDVRVGPRGADCPLTFGNFNNHAKTTPAAIALWARILRQIPGSQLLLKTRAMEDEVARQLLIERFAGHGISAERLLLEGAAPRAELLAAYNRVDIALDPMPYGGGTTTVEALWMGVPVVTLRGRTWVGRVSESILSTIGLPDLVAGNADAYVDLAVGLATDADRRNSLRSRLRAVTEASPLFDGKRFTHNLETAYREMWRSWCGNSQASELLKSALQHHRAGRLMEAEPFYRQILAINSRDADALHLLGVIAHQTGRNESAVELIGRAIAINGAEIAYYSNLSAALEGLGRNEEAANACKKSICLQPEVVEPYSNRAIAEHHLGQFGRAIVSCNRALRLKPDYAEAHCNRGNALSGLDRDEEAIAAYDKALCLQPEMVEAYSNLGVSLHSLGRFGEAIASYDRALRFKPGHAKTHSNRGSALKDIGRLDEAIAAHGKAVLVQPDEAYAHALRFMGLHYWEQSTPNTLFAAVREFGARFDRAVAGPFANPPNLDRRLRIGYVSGDFLRHPVGYFLVKVLGNHDPSAVEVFCYASGPREDDLTAQLRACVDHWRSVVGLSDQTAADMVRADGIDILIDLSGYSALNRLTMFALRPAPVQASWLGYFGTTGLTSMDYVLADRFVAPAGDEASFTEQVYRLPDSYLCFSIPDVDVQVEPRETDGPLIFGNFNNHAKTSPVAIALWARILHRVPGSRLLLKSKAMGDEAGRRLLLDRFCAHDISAERLLLEGAAPRAELLAAYNRIDIALDPMPYGGGTTTVEALWMGVPVITLRGRTWVGRVSESILSTIGLPDLVADDADAYVDIAVNLAQDAAHRNSLRSRLRAMAEASPLFDGKRFTHNLEIAYREMWRSWSDRNRNS